MPRPPKRPRYMVEEDLEAEREAEGFVGAQVSQAVEESSSSSTASSSLPSSSSSSSSSSPSTPTTSTFTTSYSVLPSMPSTQQQIPATASSLQSPQGASTPTQAVASPLSGPPMCQGIEVPNLSQALAVAESFPRDVLERKVRDLIRYLILKYRARSLTCAPELVSCIIREYHSFFPLMLHDAVECLQLVFGIDVQEIDASNHVYDLVPVLGLTYDGIVTDGLSFPKTGLLAMVLSIIYVNGDRVSEEVIWEHLNSLGIYKGVQHPIYLDVNDLLTRCFVQEQYIECQWVPNSNPARVIFLWGPRAHSETRKMQILQYLSKFNPHTTRFFQHQYLQALRRETIQAGIGSSMAS